MLANNFLSPAPAPCIGDCFKLRQVTPARAQQGYEQPSLPATGRGFVSQFEKIVSVQFAAAFLVAVLVAHFQYPVLQKQLGQECSPFSTVRSFGTISILWFPIHIQTRAL
eukprot:750661-Rhodomonas_salina.1